MRLTRLRFIRLTIAQKCMKKISIKSNHLIYNFSSLIFTKHHFINYFLSLKILFIQK